MVLEQIIKMVAEQFMIDENEISADTSFVDDLGADSLDVVELTMALEETFSLPDTPEDELTNIHTVGDLADYVSRMTALEERLGHSFRNRALLETAVTHSSYANENRASGIVCNERLEFLGDSVLGVTVADFLYRHFPDMPEGRMTRLRAELVCEQSLHRVALELHLGDYLRLGKGEEHNGGRERASILSDAVEAVIAAMYLDAGMETAAGFIHRCLLDDVRTIETPSFTDYKTALQELVQRQSGQVLSYELVGEEGPDHAKTFRMQVCLNGEPVGLGTGRTKKEAEQTAAASALEALRK